MKVKINDLLISERISVLESMKLLTKTAERCLIVINEQRKLLGTLTDGDIRRGILKGKDIDKNIKTIYSRKPLVLRKGQFKKVEARKLLSLHNLNLLPIIDKNNVVVDYLNWIKVFGEKRQDSSLASTFVVIMAGGKGARLEPFTKILPKSLIPINNKPVIEHIIEKFTVHGAKKFFLTVNYKSRILKSFFEEIKPTYSVNFFSETKPLGTAGGLKLHEGKLKDDFFVTNCDTIIDIDYGDLYNFHREKKNAITLVASAKDYVIPYGICELNKKGYLSKIKEKPRYNFLANTGLYVLNPMVISLIPKNKLYHMTELISKIKNKKMKIGVYPIEKGNWTDVGQWPDYLKTFKRF